VLSSGPSTFCLKLNGATLEIWLPFTAGHGCSSLPYMLQFSSNQRHAICQHCTAMSRLDRTEPAAIRLLTEQCLACKTEPHAAPCAQAHYSHASYLAAQQGIAQHFQHSGVSDGSQHHLQQQQQHAAANAMLIDQVRCISQLQSRVVCPQLM